MAVNKALVVLSGGQDSTTCLFLAIEQHGAESVSVITFDYGQRHRIELEAATKVAQIAGIGQRHRIIDVRGIFSGTSPLTDRDSELELYEDFNSMERTIGNRVEKTFVPGRNLVFLAIAAGIAAGSGIEEVWTGICQEDNANYPDCRSSFLYAMQAAVREAVSGQAVVRLLAPLLHLTKEQTVLCALNTPGAMQGLAYSHTCYTGTFPPCGKCHSCLLRAEGFKRAGVIDPLVARAAKP